MKILKRGKPKTKKPLFGTCRECGCKVEVMPRETKTWRFRVGYPGQYVKCPECKADYLWVK